MDIVVQRGRVVELEELPEFSIALDGFVQGPKIDAENHRYSFDHHGGCFRYCTSSACMQAWTGIMLGLNPENYTVYANDVDADVCAAIWCLKNPGRCKEPLVAKLIDAIGKSDMHGGAFDVNGMKKTVEWICAPETDAKRNGDYEKLSDDGLRSIMEAILHRIDLFADGEASIEVSKQPQRGEYNILRNKNGWALVESNDSHVFSSLYASGFDRLVVLRHQEDGSTAYTLAKRSDFIDGFPLPHIYATLNKLEPGWGGGSTIGGAPRNANGSRSRLTLEQVTNIIDGCLINPEE